MECLLCGKRSALSLCHHCQDKLERAEGVRCRLCGYPLTSEIELCMNCRQRTVFFTRHETLFPYRDKCRYLVLVWKYQQDISLSRFFSKHLVAKISSSSEHIPSLIIPVPGNPVNNRKRGYDPVRRLSREVSRLSGIPVWNGLRRDSGRAQKGCGLKDRQRNLEGMLHLKSGVINRGIKGRPIILLDDIFTTGSTLNECARLLSFYEPESISCYTIAQD